MMDAVNPARRPKKRPRGKPQLIRRRPQHPTLRLTPYAWAKLLFLRDAGPTEIGGFGISSKDDLLLVNDVALVNQRCDWASVELEDAAVADYFDRQVDAGRTPEEFGRIWVHTHPGGSAEPSTTDEETFARVFGGCDWAVMFIVANGGSTYARLQFRAGPGGSLELPVEAAYDAPFPASAEATWDDEYRACVMGPAAGAAHCLVEKCGEFDRWGWLDRYDETAGLIGEEALDAEYD